MVWNVCLRLLPFMAVIVVTSSRPWVSNTVELVDGFRPPSVPLVVVNPYLSVWSNADYLYEDTPRHWSGPPISLSGMIRIDGKAYRFMSQADDLPSDYMLQLGLKVYPTQTMYVFGQDGVQLNVTFSTPAMVTKDTIPTLPLTVISFDVAAVDDKPHSVQLYYDNTAQGAASDEDQLVEFERVSTQSHTTLRVGTISQNYCGEMDDMINWGYWYVSTPDDSTLSSSMSNSSNAHMTFTYEGKLPPDDKTQTFLVSDFTVMALSWDFGVLQPKSTISRYLKITYDQVFSINYFGTLMAPLWKRTYGDMSKLIVDTGYADKIKPLCDSMDKEVKDALSAVGNDKYYTIASLAWRQAVGGTISVWNNVTNTTWMFMKEISSDGDVSTVDVLYPSSPLFIKFNPETLKLLLLPVLDYANNQTGRYGFNIPYNIEWAPHHLGHWPVCDLFPALQEQMPMEESGNMILMTAAIVYSNTHDTEWIGPYWELLIQWGDYLFSSLPDPGNQLCTDDFEGRSPHNVNLAAKGIVALDALSYVLESGGRNWAALRYRQKIIDSVQYWMEYAYSNVSQCPSEKPQYRLQYNLPCSWSLKYNLLFQYILKLGTFPDDVIKTEEAFYTTKMNKYGIPLDDRADFTKADWEMWIAALGTEEQFSAIVEALYRFLDETPDRCQFTDWYYSSTGKQRGFTARPVVGGVFAKLLTM